MKTVVLSFFLVSLLTFFSGCSSSDGDESAPDESGLVLTVDRDTIRVGGDDRSTFTVKFDGVDVTADSKIMEIGSRNFLEHAVFMAATPGLYNFVAQYKDQNSDELSVLAVTVQLFLKNVLIQQFTSTQCPSCPSMSALLANLVSNESRCKVMALHGAFAMTPPEPFAYVDITEPLMEKFKVRGFPSVLIDQKLGSAGALDVNIIDPFLEERGEVGVAIYSSEERTKRSFEVRVKAVRNFENPCALAVFILEDGLTADQLRKVGSGVMTETVKDYVHFNVTRKKMTDVFGDRKEITWDKELVVTFPLEVPDDYENRRGMYIMAYVVDTETNKVMNCQKVKLGSDVSYEFVDYVSEND